MSARVVVPVAAHVLIRKGRGSFHAAVSETPATAGITPILGYFGTPILTFRTACGETLSDSEGHIQAWTGAAGDAELKRAIRDEPAKVCRRCDKVGNSLGAAK